MDKYEAQGMFGSPQHVTTEEAVFKLVWTYNIKEVDNRKKARCTCDGSPCSGQVRVLDFTYANCIDQTIARNFYAVSTAENLIIHGADVLNAFAEAPAPKQGFFIRPDKAFHDWWVNHKHRDPIAPGAVIPVLLAMQGHPESPQLWERHADKILWDIGLTPTIHEPCLYSGFVDRQRVLFLRQIDKFAIACSDVSTANKLLDMLDNKLTIPLKRMGLLDLYNGLVINQTRNYIKINCSTYIKQISEKHLARWMRNFVVPTRRPTPLPGHDSFIKTFLSATGDPDPKHQEILAKMIGFGYRSGIGELIYALVTCRPDISYAVVR
jgi:hypothetical protein